MSNFFKKYWYVGLLCLIVLLGFLLRLKALLINPSLWHDECSLTVSIVKRGLLGAFSPLEYNQCAPLLFMFITKVLTILSGVNELTLRFIPFLSGILSIFAFYILSKKILIKSHSKLLAIFLFCINYFLIYYSQEFKQYSTDVLLVIAGILYFSGLTFETNKQIIKNTLISIFFIFASFPVAFVILGKLMQMTKYMTKNTVKKFILYIIPLILCSISYYFVILLPNKLSQTNIFGNYWHKGFISFNLSHFLILLRENLYYFFKPNNFILITVIMIILGILQIIKERNKYGILCLYVLLFSIFASLFHIYPILGRTSLYMIPIILLCICKPLDSVSVNNKTKSIIFIFLFITSFCKYNIQYFNTLSNKKTFLRNEHPREMMDLMLKNIKKDDTIIVNNASNTEFEYYSSFYKIKNKVFREKLTGKPNSNYLLILNNFPKGYYWFYLPYDYSRMPVTPLIVSWAKTKGILYYYKNNKSILMYVYVK